MEVPATSLQSDVGEVGTPTAPPFGLLVAQLKFSQRQLNGASAVAAAFSPNPRSHILKATVKTFSGLAGLTYGSRLPVWTKRSGHEYSFSA